MRPRIVGAMVLASLAVIILSMLLDFDREYTVDTQTQIPDRPDIVSVQIAEPQPVAGNEDSPTAEQMFRFDAEREVIGISDRRNNDYGANTNANANANKANANKAQAESELKDEPPGLTDEGLPIAWVLQVASFADPDKAKALTEKLLSDQYRAYSRPASAGDKTTHRVYVGPKILKKDMLDEKSAIEQKYEVETLLLHFEP